MTDQLTIGRIVHFVQGDGQHRPAIVVNLFDGSDEPPYHAQLVVFHDGSNDRHSLVGGMNTPPSGFEREVASRVQCIGWATSIPYSEEHEPGTWHWPERA